MRQFASVSVAAALTASLLVSAAPIRRQAAAPNNDVLVLQFADVLEQLESQFYQQALSKFQESDFTSAGFSSAQLAIEQLTTIQSDESTHASVLESSLPDIGGQPISGCTFDFSSALTDLPTTLAVARTVENVGVGAYLGAASLITDPIVLEAAGSILTVEARHQTILNLLGGTGSAIPAAFDIALKPQEVLAIAGPFIQGCSTGLTPNPTLNIMNQGQITPGMTLTFQSSAINGSTDGMFCQILAGGAPFSTALPMSQCAIPSSGVQGPIAVFITSDGQPLAGNVRDRATSQLVAGPAVTFVDGSNQLMGEMIRSGSGSATASGSTVTSTISPDAANSIIASSQASPTGVVAAPGAAPSSGSSSGPASGSGSVSSPGASPSSASGSVSGPGASPSSAGTTPNIPATNDVASPNGPNQYTGLSPDGKEQVNGVSSIPASAVQTASLA